MDVEDEKDGLHSSISPAEEEKNSRQRLRLWGWRQKLTSTLLQIDFYPLWEHFDHLASFAAKQHRSCLNFLRQKKTFLH